MMPKKILVIEDDRNLLEIIGEFLDAWGFTVLSASDGKKGLDVFRSEAPDLVLCDVLLPAKSGFEVCEGIRGDPERPKTPIILMSAVYKTAKMQTDAKARYGLKDYLVKPLDLKKTAGRITEILGVTKEEMLKEKEQVTLANVRQAAELTEKAEEAEKAEKAEKESGDHLDPLPPAAELGDLSKVSPLFVLFSFFREERTGIVKFLRGKVTKRVFLRRGDPIYITSTNQEESFGRILAQDGILAEDQLEWVRKKSREEGKLIGQTLVAEGLIDKSLLAQYLIKEVRLRVEDLLTWKEGNFIFEDDDSFLERIKRPSLRMINNFYRLAREGVLDEEFRDRYSRCLGAVVEKTASRLSLMGEIDWEQEDLVLVTLLNGERKIGELINEPGQSAEEVFRVLGVLEHAGVIHFPR